MDSDGAIILTNDGELCHLVSHPRFGVGKTYRVEVEGQPLAANVERLQQALEFLGAPLPADVQAAL